MALDEHGHAGPDGPNRCKAHGLVVRPDGLCVLCRRQLESGRRKRLWGIAAALVLVLVFAGTLVFIFFSAAGNLEQEYDEDESFDLDTPDEEPLVAQGEQESPNLYKRAPSRHQRDPEEELERAKRRVKVTMYMAPW